jgi:hypothetical protein
VVLEDNTEDVAVVVSAVHEASMEAERGISDVVAVVFEDITEVVAVDV